MTSRNGATPAGKRRSRLPPRLIGALVLTALSLIFIIENNQAITIRVLVPVVTMPLWAALAGMLVVGGAIGYALTWRQR